MELRRLFMEIRWYFFENMSKYHQAQKTIPGGTGLRNAGTVVLTAPPVKIRLSFIC